MYSGIGSDFRYVSIVNCWDSYYCPKPRPIFHPLVLSGISSGTIQSSVCWNRLRLQNGVNYWLLIQLLSIDWPNTAQYSTSCFCMTLLSGKTHSSVCWNIIRLQRAFNWWLLRQFYQHTESWSITHPLFLIGIIISQNPLFYPLE